MGLDFDGGIIAVDLPMGAESKEIGQKGESAAAEYLKKLGWKVLERNYRTSRGEIDLIAKDGDVLIFVEVKNYSCRSFYLPSFSIDKNKRQCIIKAARTYLFKKNIRNMNCRFDAVTIYRNFQGHKKIEHYRNAFEIC